MYTFYPLLALVLDKFSDFSEISRVVHFDDVIYGASHANRSNILRAKCRHTPMRSKMPRTLVIKINIKPRYSRYKIRKSENLVPKC